MTEHRWQVYILRGSDDRLYTGITTDIRRRWREHLSGRRGARYFRGRQPVELCYLEHHPDRASASQREYAIKQLDRRAKEALIARSPAPTVTPEPAS